MPEFEERWFPLGSKLGESMKRLFVNVWVELRRLRRRGELTASGVEAIGGWALVPLRRGLEEREQGETHADSCRKGKRE